MRARLLALIERVRARRLLSSLIGVAALLAGFHWVDRWIFAEARLPAAVFSSRTILWEALKNPRIGVVFAALGLVPLVRRRETSWRALRSPELRIVIVTGALVLAWAYATYDYNHYFDRAHALDRLVVAALALLVIVHPGFVGPLVVAVILVARQFDVPMGSYTWTDKRVAFDLLVLSHVWVCLHGLVRHRPHALWLLALALIAGNYVDAGLGKVSMHWLERDQLWNLFVAAHANGWLANLGEPLVLSIARGLKAINALLLFTALASELLPLLWLAHRRFAIAGIAFCVLLHLGIFAASGICFWKWIFIDTALVVALWRLPKREARAIFGPRSVYLWLSIPLVYFVPQWASAVRLAWYDTELNTMFELEAVGESGQVYPVARGFMSPYDVVFSQNRFFYLAPERTIQMTFGVHQDWRIAEAVSRARTGKEIRAVEKRFGRTRGGPGAASARRFDQFIQRYFASVNRRGKRGGPIGLLGAPHHIWNMAPPGAFTGQEPARQVRVRLRQTFFRDDRSLDVLQDKVVRVIEIPAE